MFRYYGDKLHVNHFYEGTVALFNYSVLRLKKLSSIEWALKSITADMWQKGVHSVLLLVISLKKNSPFFFVNQPSSNSIASPISRGVSSSPNGLAFETDKTVISPRERIKTQELFISMEYFLIGKSVNT